MNPAPRERAPYADHLRKIGFTGTRIGLSEPQWYRVDDFFFDVIAFDHYDVEFHNGACVGSDEESFGIADVYGAHIKVHPPEDERLMMDLDPWRDNERITILPAKPYHDRNRDIVDDSNELIATPEGEEKWTGGTWYTIHYAQSQGKPVTIFYPDGRIEHR